MKIVSHIKREDWEEFLKSSSGARLVHTPQWKDFLEKSFNFEGKHLFSLDENGLVTGMLPLFRSRRMLGGSKLCASPFSGECSFIGDERSFGQTLEAAMDLAGESAYLEIRSPIVDNGFEVKNSFSTYILELSTDVSVVWERLNKGSVRRYIKKSLDKGVRVIETRDMDDLKAFYELNCINKKEKGVPSHPWGFFKNMFELAGNYTKLYLSMYEGVPIAGGIMNFYKENMSYGYGASDPNYLDHYPNNAFLWKSIQDACLSGYKYYDFGRVSYDNTGLINFKQRWGTVEKKLYYSFHPRSPSTFTEDRKNFKFELATNVIKRTPMVIYKNFSNAVFKYFG